jgi:site-specific DNA-methyltransferase (adenine-specific)
MKGPHRTNRQSRSGDLNGIEGLAPFWSNSAAALYEGEMLHLLPRLEPGSVDAVITDPPYSSGGTTSSERMRDPADKYCQNGHTCGRPTFAGDMRDQRSFKYWCTLWLSLARQATRTSGFLLVFIDWRQLPTMTDAVQAAGWTWRGVAAWNKGRGSRAPHKGYFRHQCEYVVVATDGRCEKAEHGGPWDGCFDVTVRKSDKFHITGKPTELMRRLTEVVPPGGLVLDPFAGSASTGVACLQTGRRFVGIEQSAEYCAISATRLAGAARAATTAPAPIP